MTDREVVSAVQSQFGARLLPHTVAYIRREHVPPGGGSTRGFTGFAAPRRPGGVHLINSARDKRLTVGLRGAGTILACGSACAPVLFSFAIAG